MKKNIITLTQEERQQLEALVTKGKAAARKLTRARVLLKADRSPAGPAWSDERISEALEVSVRTVANVRQRFVLEGLDVALGGHSTRNQRVRRIDGEGEARLIAALCGPAPTGFGRWSLRLLADKAVELQVVPEPISQETVRQTLAANELKPWRKQEWCIPPEANGEFVCHMEDILEVYRRPVDAKRPVVCLDEMPYQLVSEVRQPQPQRRRQVERYDYEYKREGVANLFLVFAPLLGRRWVRVTQRRTRKDWTRLVRDLVDGVFAEAEVLVLVLDNLNIHVGGALYEAFPPAEARRLLRKLEIHYTPKHGSWLNMAEIEFSVLSRQCLERRLDSQDQLEREVIAWTQARNASSTTVDWRFTTAEARIKLKRLYPVVADSALPPLADLTALGEPALAPAPPGISEQPVAEAPPEPGTLPAPDPVARLLAPSPFT